MKDYNCTQKESAQSFAMAKIDPGEDIFIVGGDKFDDLKRILRNKKFKGQAMPGLVYSVDKSGGLSRYAARHIPRGFKVVQRVGKASTVARDLWDEGVRLTYVDHDCMSSFKCKDRAKFLQTGILTPCSKARGSVLAVTLSVRNDGINKHNTPNPAERNTKRASLCAKRVLAALSKAPGWKKPFLLDYSFITYNNKGGKEFVRDKYKNRHSPMIKVLLAIGDKQYATHRAL